MYAPTQTNLDRDLVISNAQVLNSSSDVAGTTEIDLGGVNMGKPEALKVVINVTALSGTLDIKLAHKTSASVAVTDNTITLKQIGAGLTGQYHITLPQNCNRYINLFYTAGTSGTVTAWVTALVS